MRAFGYAVTSTRLLRITLWISIPFNLGAAGVFALPSSAPGQLLGLSPSVDPVYVALCCFMVALFGLTYAWLAMQPRVDRPMLCLAAVGKSGVFVLCVGLWLFGNASGALVAAASGDLLLAIVWFRWLLLQRPR